MASSFEEVEQYELDDYCNMSPVERLELMQQLREVWENLQGEAYQNECRKGLQRVITVIQ